jgi:hypothetical protein
MYGLTALQQYFLHPIPALQPGGLQHRQPLEVKCLFILPGYQGRLQHFINDRIIFYRVSILLLTMFIAKAEDKLHPVLALFDLSLHHY